MHDSSIDHDPHRHRRDELEYGHTRHEIRAISNTSHPSSYLDGSRSLFEPTREAMRALSARNRRNRLICSLPTERSLPHARFSSELCDTNPEDRPGFYEEDCG